MNIQIYQLKRTHDVQKAERYFKERRVPFHTVDLTRHALGLRELEAFKAQIGLKDLIDAESIRWKESTARFLTGETAILEALMRDPKLLRLPIVRNGRFATCGYQPEVWRNWT